MSDTTRLGLALLAAAQAQKHVTHNEAILKLDGLVQMTALSYSTSAQPSSPSDGDLYLLPAGKTGADWGGYANYAVAHYYDGIWHQYQPAKGWICFAQDTGYLYYYTGTQWAVIPATGMADGGTGAPGLPFSADTDTGLYRIGANTLGIAAGGAEKARVDSNGFSFDGGTTHFQTGTFTPGLTFGGSSTGLAFSSRSGSYVALGPLVLVQFFLALSSKGSSTGTARLTGLPFNVASANLPTGLASVAAMSGLTAYPAMVVLNSTTTAVFIATDTSGTNLTDSNFTNSTTVNCGFWYTR